MIKFLPVLFMTVFAVNASAAVPVGVTNAISTAVTDVGVIGAAILIVVVAIAGFSWLRKPIH